MIIAWALTGELLFDPIFGMFWNLTAALSGNGPKVAKFLDR